MKIQSVLFPALLSISASLAQQSIEVSQPNISGSGPASILGSPFGQSFIPTSLFSLIVVDLAVVDTNGVGDIQVSLYDSDASGAALVGSPITSGSITAAQILSYYTAVATPLWFPVYFDQPYPQTPGEHLAFTITGSSLDFYYGPGSSYPSGRLLGDATKDLTFNTVVVPEPASVGLFFAAGLCFFLCRYRLDPARRVQGSRHP